MNHKTYEEAKAYWSPEARKARRDARRGMTEEEQKETLSQAIEVQMKITDAEYEKRTKEIEERLAATARGHYQTSKFSSL